MLFENPMPLKMRLRMQTSVTFDKMASIFTKCTWQPYAYLNVEVELMLYPFLPVGNTNKGNIHFLLLIKTRKPNITQEKLNDTSILTRESDILTVLHCENLLRFRLLEGTEKIFVIGCDLLDILAVNI